jgi:hypothetical protein
VRKSEGIAESAHDSLMALGPRYSRKCSGEAGRAITFHAAPRRSRPGRVDDPSDVPDRPEVGDNVGVSASPAGGSIKADRWVNSGATMTAALPVVLVVDADWSRQSNV